MPRERVGELFEFLRSTGVALEDLELPDDFGVPEEQITAMIDVERKRKALEAHASQGENIFMLRMPLEAQQRAFGSEGFIRAVNRVPEAADREDDLFDGLR
ncbi:hypothetical protein [Streptosporangium sp. NPDC050280]|uniref:hypothetical protein n=1 Tax=unclassified Streptosporangium TaxID=2632669 RepID=UPI0034341DD1